jgi:hypothetical protein
VETTVADAAIGDVAQQPVEHLELVGVVTPEHPWSNGSLGALAE